MAFKEGHKKVGGRKAKTPNKITKEVRQAVSQLVQLQHEEFIKRMNKLPDRDFCEIYTRLLPFVVPKLQALKADIASDGTNIQIQVIRLSDGTEIPM